jgi:hypothetical protein
MSFVRALIAVLLLSFAVVSLPACQSSGGGGPDPLKGDT